MVNGEKITVTVTKKTGEVPNDFGPGTYTLGVTGATAESVTTTANQKELKFTLTEAVGLGEAVAVGGATLTVKVYSLPS